MWRSSCLLCLSLSSWRVRVYDMDQDLVFQKIIIIYTYVLLLPLSSMGIGSSIFLFTSKTAA